MRNERIANERKAAIGAASDRMQRARDRIDHAKIKLDKAIAEK